METKFIFMFFIAIALIIYGLWLSINAKKVLKAEIEAHKPFMHSKIWVLRWIAKARINMAKNFAGTLWIRIGGVFVSLGGLLLLLVLLSAYPTN